MIGNIEGKILPHHSKANEANISIFGGHFLLFWSCLMDVTWIAQISRTEIINRICF
jgi:hypothetical protein